MCFINFEREELFKQLAMGRELEFSLNGLPLFIGRDSKNVPYLYNEANKKVLYSGELEGLFAFQFSTGESLNNCIEAFDFEFLL